MDKCANLCSRAKRWKMCLVHDATSNRLARKHTDFSLAGALRDAHQCSPKKLHRRDNVIVLSLGSMTLLSTEIEPAPYFGFCVYCLRGVFFCASGSKLQALAWNGATSTVQEAVASIEAGRPRPRLFTESTLTIADAITLRQLGGSMEETIAKLIDHDKRSAKPNATKPRVSCVAKAAAQGCTLSLRALLPGCLRTEICVGVNAQLAQHITLPLVSARALCGFCLILIQVNSASHSAYSYLGA